MGRPTAPRGLRFFFDACFPPAVAAALAQIDRHNQYCHLIDEPGLQPDTPDVVWLPGLDRDRIVISGDGRILTKPLERKAWVDSMLRGFFVNDTFPNKPLWEQASWMIERWEAVLVAARKAKPGDTHKIPWSGRKMELWMPGPSVVKSHLR